MMRLLISAHVVTGLILAVVLTLANADTYTWVDEQWTVHFTDDPGLVPKLSRTKVKKLDESAYPQPSPGAGIRKEERQNAPLSDEMGAFQETYGGKSYDQWAKEFTDREEAMTAVRRRIDENAEQVRNAGLDWEVQEKLFTERKALSAQFREMKAQYFQQVEIARKAGLKITIEQ